MAIASPYSTKTKIRLIAPELTTTDVSDANLDLIITEADADIEIDLSGALDLSTIKDLSAIPPALSRMSECLARAYAYRYLYGNRTIQQGQEDLAAKWYNRYKEILARVESAKSIFLDSSDSSVEAFNYTVNRAASEKLFGTGDYYEYDSDVD